MSNKQIKKIYASHAKIKNEKTTFIKRHKNLKLLKKSLGDIGEKSVFRNSFFVTHIDTIIKNRPIIEYDFLTIGKALDIIVNETIDNERRLYNKLHGHEKSKDDFKKELLAVLDEVALEMEKNDVDILHTAIQSNDDKKLEMIKKKLKNYISTRALVVKNDKYLEFLHRMLFEYFIARNILKIDRSKRRTILKGSTSHDNVADIYAFFLYDKKHLLEYIEAFGDSLKSSHKRKEHDYYRLLQLVKATRAVIRDYTPKGLKITEIASILPVLETIDYLNYKDVSIDKLINGQLCLENKGLTNLKEISKFIYFRKLNLIGNAITDFIGLRKYRHFEELKISSSSVPYLKQIKNIAIDLLYVVIEDNKQDYLTQLLENRNAEKIEIHFNLNNSMSYDEIVGFYTSINTYFNENDKLSFEKVSIILNNNIIDKNDKLSFGNVRIILNDNIIDKINPFTNAFFPVPLKERDLMHLELLYCAHQNIGFENDDIKIHLLKTIIRCHMLSHGSMPSMKSIHSLDIDAYDNKARYSEEFNYMKVLEFCNEILSTDENDSFAYFCRAVLYMDIKQYKNAIYNIKKCIDLHTIGKNGNLDNLYFFLARSYEKIMNYDKAIKNYEKAIKLQSHNGSYNFFCARANYKNKNYEEAVIFFTKAIDLGKIWRACYQYRGISYYNIGKKAEALEDKEKAIELYPSCISEFPY